MAEIQTLSRDNVVGAGRVTLVSHTARAVTGSGGREWLISEGKVPSGEAVRFSQIPLGHLAQIAGWQQFDERAEEALRRAGAHLPNDYRIPVRRAGQTVWRTAANRALVRSDAPLHLTSSDGLMVLDLSDARQRFRVSGPGAAALFSRLAPLDFSEAALPPATFVQTGIHHIGVLIDRLGAAEFELYVPTTWATSICDFIGAHLHGA